MMEAMNERRFKTALRVYVRVCACMFVYVCQLFMWRTGRRD